MSDDAGIPLFHPDADVGNLPWPITWPVDMATMPITGTGTATFEVNCPANDEYVTMTPSGFLTCVPLDPPYPPHHMHNRSSRMIHIGIQLTIAVGLVLIMISKASRHAMYWWHIVLAAVVWICCGAIIALSSLAGCGSPVADPHHPACIVGRDCPDAAVDAPIDASYPSCALPVPTLPPCTCGAYLCSSDAGVELHNVCGPQCDAGVGRDAGLD